MFPSANYNSEGVEMNDERAGVLLYFQTQGEIMLVKTGEEAFRKRKVMERKL